MSNVKKDFDVIQKGAAVVGGAIVGIIGASVKTAANFEQAMARLSAISGASAAELSKLEETAREMGATTQYSAT